MKKYRELTFVDDFMFCKVMTANPDLCRRVLSLILGKPVKKITIRGAQQTIEITAGSRGIRMDVYLDDGEDTVYDMEMQTTSRPCLARRLRYYQSMLDLNHLESGKDYGELPHTVIVFICTFDYFRKQLPVYRFENRCTQMLSLPLGDGVEKIFVNPRGSREGLDREFEAFLDYLTGKKAADGLAGEIEAAVERAREHKEWEVEYMTWQAFEMDARREGREEGRKEGRAEGRKEGRAEGIIKSGRRHGFSDEVIIEDIREETGCSYMEAEALLKNYDSRKIPEPV